MENLFEQIEMEIPLTLERETDARDTWPKRWKTLKSRVAQSISNREDDMYKMHLHDEIKIDCIDTVSSKWHFTILRVPGGWIYRWPNQPPEFVPFNNEFWQPSQQT